MCSQRVTYCSICHNQSNLFLMVLFILFMFSRWIQEVNTGKSTKSRMTWLKCRLWLFLQCCCCLSYKMQYNCLQYRFLSVINETLCCRYYKLRFVTKVVTYPWFSVPNSICAACTIDFWVAVWANIPHLFIRALHKA